MEDARGVPEAQSAPLSFSEESILEKIENPIDFFFLLKV
jgi:hypothetical protein